MCIADKFRLACFLCSDVARLITIIVIVICFLFFDKHVSNLLTFFKRISVRDARWYYDHHLTFKFFLFFFFIIMIKRCCCFSTFWDRFVDDMSLYNRKLNRKFSYLFFCSSKACFMRELIIKMIWLISRIVCNFSAVNKYWMSISRRQRS